MINYIDELSQINGLIEGKNPRDLGIAKLRENKLSDSTGPHVKWQVNLDATVELLDRLEIDYVLMKYIDIPYAVMKDTDLLIENNNDVRSLLKALAEMNFQILNKGIKRSDKSTAIGYYGQHSRVEIDIYVDPTWWMIKYAPTGFISSNKTRQRILQKVVSVPSRTHSVFMLATHSYWHGCVTMSEVAQVAKLILNEGIRWDDLLLMAKSRHLAHPLYLYLCIVDDLFDMVGHRDVQLQKSISSLRDSTICKLMVSAVKSRNEGFPLKIPYEFKVVSAWDEIQKSLLERRISYQEFESYFFALLLGRRVNL
jgi:hypothetical protein